MHVGHCRKPFLEGVLDGHVDDVAGCVELVVTSVVPMTGQCALENLAMKDVAMAKT